MKNFLIKIFSIAVVAVLVLAACKKDTTNVYFEGGTAPVLTASMSDSIPLSAADSLNPSVLLSWTNPNYQFNNGISSLNVTYYIEFDTLGANFTSPTMQQVAISPSLDTQFTVGQINTILGNGLLLGLGQSHNIQIRVEAFLAPLVGGSPNIAPLYSNVLNYTVTPYAPPPKVVPPSTGTLFIVGGDPKLGGWTNSVPTSQQFTQVSPTLYSIVVALSGGDPTNTNASDQYGVISQNGTWNGQFGVPSANLTPAYSGSGTFNANGQPGGGTNFPGPTNPGTYKIVLNFQTGTYTVTLQ